MIGFQPGDRIVRKALRGGNHDNATVISVQEYTARWGGTFNENVYTPVRWPDKMIGSVSTNDFEVKAQPLAELIAEKEATIAEAQALIRKAKAELEQLTTPKAGETYQRKTDKATVAKVLYCGEGQVFFSFTSSFNGGGFHHRSITNFSSAYSRVDD